MEHKKVGKIVASRDGLAPPTFTATLFDESGSFVRSFPFDTYVDASLLVERWEAGQFQLLNE